MIVKPHFLRLWLVNVMIVPIFVGCLWGIGIPLDNMMIWLFLAVALSLFTLVSAVCGVSFVSNRVDERGISCSFPFSGQIAWDHIQSISRQWPFLRIKGHTGEITFLPMRWLMKNRAEFDKTVAMIAEKNEMAKKLKDIA